MSQMMEFVVARPTLDLLEELKEAFGVRTDIEVLRRSLALARLFAEVADEDGVVTVIGRSGEPVHLALRESSRPVRTIGHRLRWLQCVLGLIPRAPR